MSESIIYDVALRIMFDTYRTLEELKHPKARIFETIKKDFPMLITSATERLRNVSLDAEVQQLQDFLRYASTTLTRVYLSGDWRPHVFLSEIFYEVLPLKRLHEWVIDMSKLPSSPQIAEINSIIPLTSAKISSRLGGKQILLFEANLIENTLFREILDEYSRRYAMNDERLLLSNVDEINRLKESLDFLYVGSLDAWRLGWPNILSLASQLLKRKGNLSLILPINQREGLKTFLKLFDVPEYPEPEKIIEDLQRQRFTNIYTSKGSGFLALVAARR
ncbi:MAG: hypothetical protein ACPLRJ_00385 [Infirmifilum uzonense]|uniref:hypothetical protein n=1 Tax=Infirmifilum uzonense TaxID=1550241 RepID=UPI003C7288ED